MRIRKKTIPATKRISYSKGFKYQLRAPVSFNTPLRPPKDIIRPYIRLDADGLLVLSEGYAWDGPSGPVIDTRPKLRASLAHDGLYQLARRGFLQVADMVAADRFFADTCVEDGLAKWRARIYYKGLRLFGGRARSPKNQRGILHAP